MVNELENGIDVLIQQARKSAEATNGMAGAVLLESINSFLYSNLVQNLFRNLNDENIEEYQLKVEECANVKIKYNWILEKSNKYLENNNPENALLFEEYKNFKEEIKCNYPSIHTFLLEIEKLFGLSNCVTKINDFEKYLDTIEGPTFKIKVGSPYSDKNE